MAIERLCRGGRGCNCGFFCQVEAVWERDVHWPIFCWTEYHLHLQLIANWYTWGWRNRSLWSTGWWWWWWWWWWWQMTNGLGPVPAGRRRKKTFILSEQESFLQFGQHRMNSFKGRDQYYSRLQNLPATNPAPYTILCGNFLWSTHTHTHTHTADSTNALLRATNFQLSTNIQAECMTVNRWTMHGRISQM